MNTQKKPAGLRKGAAVWTLAAFALLFGMTVAGCGGDDSNESNDNTKQEGTKPSNPGGEEGGEKTPAAVAKTIVVSEASAYDGVDGAMIVVPTGTTDAALEADAKVYFSKSGTFQKVKAGGEATISNGTATVPLYGISSANNDFSQTRWTESGTFDVWMAVEAGGGSVDLYKASNVSITSETTTIKGSALQKIEG